MADQITTAAVTEAIEAAVEERGSDYVYPPAKSHDNCQYVIDGKPSCLVGVVLHRLGASIDQLRQEDVAVFGNGTMAEDLVHKLHTLGILEFEDPYTVGAALESAQLRQDRADTWGRALEEYAKHV